MKEYNGKTVTKGKGVVLGVKGRETFLQKQKQTKRVPE